MKVIIVHTDFRIYWPARLKALMEYLLARDISLDIVEISGSGSPYFFAEKIKGQPGNWHCLFPEERIEDIFPADANLSVIKKLDEILPDIVISGPIAFPSGAAAVSWAVRNERKIIVFDDARLIDVPRSWLVDFVRRRVYSCVDAVLCPASEWISTYSHFGFTREQLFYGVDVVDNSFWNKVGDPSESSPVGSKYFLTVGRQIPKKNFMFLLRSYNKYVKNVTDPLHLVLVGEGPEQEHLRSFIKGNDLDNLVHLYPFMSQEKLRPFYQSASWFILPSRFGETWGLVVNEAMASGLPVLVSEQTGSASTLVKEGINGYTFSPDNENGLSDLILKMGKLTDGERKEMGLRSVEIISGWGLDRFCKGAYEAIQYVSSHELTKPGLISRLILKLWKGRYRPV